MKSLYDLLYFGALIFFVWSLVTLLFGRGQKLRKLGNVGLSIVTLAFAMAQLDRLEDEAARQSGFLDAADKSWAHELGIADPAEWSERRSAELLKQRKAAAFEEERLKFEERAREAEKAKDERAALKARMASLECWGEKAAFQAAFHCAPVIERFAKHDFEWTDGMLEPKFSQYRWKDKRVGIVTVMGDKIKMQNGFGAWTYMTYECDIDPLTEAVSDVRVAEGRL